MASLRSSWHSRGVEESARAFSAFSIWDREYCPRSRVGNMSADELREQVAAAARAAQTAAKVAASPSGKSSKQMLAKVRADLRALEEIVKS